MKRKPLVSIVIIFLNAEEFIQEAIESVFAQTYDNWELFLVDDGSKYACTEIASRYAKQYPQRVHYLEHDDHRNRGMSASRNLGIANAKGKYIAFLDADDVWLPYKLEQQLVILEGHPEADMVYGPSQWWYSWTGNSEDTQHDFIQKLGVDANILMNPPNLLPLFLQNNETIPLPSNILVRRKTIKDVNGFEEVFRSMYEDQAFLAKACLEVTAFIAGEIWVKYRQHPDACCSVAVRSGQHHSARLAFLNWLEEYLLKQEAKDGEVWRVLQKELWPYRHPVLNRLLRRAQHLVKRIKSLLKLIGQRILPVSACR